MPDLTSSITAKEFIESNFVDTGLKSRRGSVIGAITVSEDSEDPEMGRGVWIASCEKKGPWVDSDVTTDENEVAIPWNRPDND